MIWNGCIPTANFVIHSVFVNPARQPANGSSHSKFQSPTSPEFKERFYNSFNLWAITLSISTVAGIKVLLFCDCDLGSAEILSNKN
jgi:hypothetical protein